MSRKYSLKFVLTLMLIASALTCTFFLFGPGRGLALSGGRYDAANAFSSLLEQIDELYIGEYTEADLTSAAMHAAVTALDDRWSYYMTDAEYAEYLNHASNQYVGIGIGVEIDDTIGGLRVLSVYPGSSAEKAGLTAGDVITAVDDIDVTQMALDEITAIMAREVGGSLVLLVLREDSRTETITAVYDYVYKDPVSYEMLPELVGYIKIENFDSGAASSFISAVSELIDGGATAFVFDVRNNGGGLVSELTKMLDCLVDDCEVFVAVKKGGEEDVSWASPNSSVNLPITVLVNRYSYSAAEYFAAMLREYGMADIVGEQTTGKNRSQITIPLPDGGALHISSGEYLTKNRVSLTEVGGLTPDYPVTVTDEEFAALYYGKLAKADDTQLQKALEMPKK